MRWFTPRWYGWTDEEVSEEEQESAWLEYRAHATSIAHRLPDGLMRFVEARDEHGALSLHDGGVEAAVYSESRLLTLRVLCGDHLIGYRRLHLRYLDADFGDVDSEAAIAKLMEPDAVLLYDEVDVAEDNRIEHRFLLWPIDQLTIRCSSAEYESEPLTPEAYRGAWQAKMNAQQVPEEIVAALEAAWNFNWPTTPPAADRLRTIHANRWVRFHSLPQSKRYADTEEERATILRRHRAVMEELGAKGTLYIVSARFAVDDLAEPNWRGGKHHPGARHWRTLLPEEWPEAPTHVHASVAEWASPGLDAFLLAVADELIVGAIVGPMHLAWLYHPYDGGADVIARSADEREQLKIKFADWLSRHPQGL